MEEEELEKLSEIVREKLVNGDNKLGFLKRTTRDISPRGDPRLGDEYSGEKRYMGSSIVGIMPESIYKLAQEYGIGFPPEIVTTGTWGIQLTSKKLDFSSNEYDIKLEKCKEKKAKKLEKIMQSKSKKYDKPGFLVLPKYRKYEFVDIDKEFVKPTPEAYIRVKMTQRELALAGIAPEDFEWELINEPRVTPRDIANADNEQSLTKTEETKAISIFTKIRNLFKGKDGR